MILSGQTVTRAPSRHAGCAGQFLKIYTIDFDHDSGRVWADFFQECFQKSKTRQLVSRKTPSEESCSI